MNDMHRIVQDPDAFYDLRQTCNESHTRLRFPLGDGGTREASRVAMKAVG